MSTEQKTQMNIEKEIHQRGGALLKEMASILNLKGMAGVVPYPVAKDNLFIEVAGDILTVTGRNDNVPYLNVFLSGESFECRARNKSVKPLSATRSKNVKEIVTGLNGVMDFFSAKVNRFTVEGYGKGIAYVADLSNSVLLDPSNPASATRRVSLVTRG